MMQWFRRLMPREERFFEMFARHADAVVRGATELRGMLEGGAAVQRHYPAVLAAEDDADVVTREVVQAVRRTFVTPFDRGDIQTLIGRMDDTIDQMKKAAKAIVLFEMTAFDPELQRMAWRSSAAPACCGRPCRCSRRSARMPPASTSCASRSARSRARWTISMMSA
jgi:uncharacterized protein Yka (UPF0111/DUF47 family)